MPAVSGCRRSYPSASGFQSRFGVHESISALHFPIIHPSLIIWIAALALSVELGKAIRGQGCRPRGRVSEHH